MIKKRDEINDADKTRCALMGRDIGTANNEGYTRHAVVKEAFEGHAVIAQCVAVIAGEYDEGIVEYAMGFECGDNFANAFVNQADVGVVVLAPFAVVLWRGL